MVDNTGKISPESWICLGIITGAVGVRGEVRVKTFTESPEDLNRYGPVTAMRSGKVFVVKGVRPVKGGVAARLETVNDRNAAEALKGEQLSIARAALPAPEDDETFYHADLIGLAVRNDRDEKTGTVTAVYDFGAGDVLEIALDDESAEKSGPRVIMVAFTRETVPQIDLNGGWLRLATRPEEDEEKD